MDTLHLDWETRSAVDLKKSGLHVYASDPTTDIWLASYAFNDEPVETWIPGYPVPERIKLHIMTEQPVWAHNAPFEMLICNEIAFKRYNWPVLFPHQCVCTMAMCYAMALPASLEKAADALGLEFKKDMAGKRLMQQMARPKPKTKDSKAGPQWWTDPDKFERLKEYGKQDVEVERLLAKKLMQLSQRERNIWLLDYKINQRGVGIDLKAVRAAIQLVHDEKNKLDEKMRELTSGAVDSCTATVQLTDWLKCQGVEVEGVSKSDVVELLAKDNLPAGCRRALEIRREAAKTSTAKLQAMLMGACADGRMRGMFQYHGAGTGRWAGRRVQLQNLPRPYLTQDEIEGVFNILRGIDEHGSNARGLSESVERDES